MAFSVLAFSQMLRALNQRSVTETVWVRAEGINLWLILSFMASAVLMGCILLIPSLREAFRLTGLNGFQWLTVFGLSLLSLVQMEAVKLQKPSGSADHASQGAASCAHEKDHGQFPQIPAQLLPYSEGDGQ